MASGAHEGRRRRRRRRLPAGVHSAPALLPSPPLSLGVTSGFYMFNEPLKKHFEEQAKQLAEQQAAEGSAAPTAAAAQSAAGGKA